MLHRSRISGALVFVGLVGYMIVAALLVEQHRTPTAVAQVTSYLRERSSDRTEIVADPLVVLMLQRQGVPGRFHEVPAMSRDSAIATFSGGSDLIVIGEPGRERSRFHSRSFFHNPYTNPVWPVITLHERADGP